MSLPALSKESIWYPLDRQRLTIPRLIKPWLHEPDSLTQALIDCYLASQFRVKVYFQGKQTASRTEQHRLQIPARRQAIVREVQLYSGTQPTVFARTLIPVTHLKGQARRLGQLGEKPLGAVLFADPRTRRLAVEITQLSIQHSLYSRASQAIGTQPSIIWGRRTLYQYAGQRLLVNEFFMPNIQEHPRCRITA